MTDHDRLVSEEWVFHDMYPDTYFRPPYTLTKKGDVWTLSHGRDDISGTRLDQVVGYAKPHRSPLDATVEQLETAGWCIASRGATRAVLAKGPFTLEYSYGYWDMWGDDGSATEIGGHATVLGLFGGKK